MLYIKIFVKVKWKWNFKILPKVKRKWKFYLKNTWKWKESESDASESEMKIYFRTFLCLLGDSYYLIPYSILFLNLNSNNAFYLKQRAKYSLDLKIGKIHP